MQAKDEAVPDSKGRFSSESGPKPRGLFPIPIRSLAKARPYPNRSVLVSCKLYWPYPESVAYDGYWYRLVSKPWRGRLAPANSFWNGDVPGQPYTHSTDWAVRECEADELPQR